eukprot:5600576-Pyramimonas_sp.AAC.1
MHATRAALLAHRRQGRPRTDEGPDRKGPKRGEHEGPRGREREGGEKAGGRGPLRTHQNRTMLLPAVRGPSHHYIIPLVPRQHSHARRRSAVRGHTSLARSSHRTSRATPSDPS